MEEVGVDEIDYEYRDYSWYDWRSTAYEPVLSLPGIEIHAHIIWILLPIIFPYTRPIALPIFVVMLITLIIISKKDLGMRNAWPRLRSYLASRTGSRPRSDPGQEFLRKRYQ